MIKRNVKKRIIIQKIWLTHKNPKATQIFKENNETYEKGSIKEKARNISKCHNIKTTKKSRKR